MHYRFHLWLISSFLTFGLLTNADATECTYSPDALKSWKALFQRQLRVLDTTHAEQMTKIASDIIDGADSALSVDMSGVDPNTTFKLHGGEMTMLELAAAACHLSIVKKLIAAGAFVDGLKYSTPLVTAAGHGQEIIVEYLLQHGANISKIDIHGHTALEKAVRNREVLSARALLMHGAEVNQRIQKGATVIDLVGSGTDVESKAMAEELRRHGAISELSAAPQINSK